MYNIYAHKIYITSLELIHMTDAMDALFLYAQEHRIRPLLDTEPEFSQVVLCLERQDKSFRALLDKETETCFEKFLSEQALLDLFNERAAFRAGFQIALELER